MSEEQHLVLGEPKPVDNIVFYDRDNNHVGTLWFDVPLRFEGSAEESAKVFFEHVLKQLAGEYLKWRAGEGEE